ncbi:MAG: thioredoxin family protein [Saprospirales bacterium]|nr:MAG: thioredoxin family protein [Saprospirales bacterium]
MKKNIFYHAGCSVCKSAENEILQLIDKDSVEIVNLGDQPEKILPAKEAGLKSVPALVTSSGTILHINYGASIEDLIS